jgi:hypothetical protein
MQVSSGLYDMVSVATIADMAGVDTGIVQGWAQGEEDFPTPIAHLTTGNLYDRRAVEKWLLERGYRGVEPAPAP